MPQTKPLTVLSVAYPFAPVGADGVGGAEQILSEIDRALVAAGHVSLVAACQDSQPAGRLFSIPPPRRDVFDDDDRRWSRKQLQAAIDRALQLHRVDLVHMHGLDFCEYRLPSSIPVLATLHMPIAWYGLETLQRLRGRVQFCCVSESQRRTCPPELGDLPVVENGVALPPQPSQPEKGDYALVLGRICPEKNVHAALQAGDRAGLPVWLGGRVFPYRAHKEYFEQQVRPLLREDTGSPLPRHRFLGTLRSPERQSLLTRARCLLHPTLAPETSSLAAMEALAAGTPVIAYRSGALPEIVEHGVTGFLVNSVEEMGQAIGRIHDLSPGACRQSAERRFSVQRMVQNYFELYRQLALQGAAERVYA